MTSKTVRHGDVELAYQVREAPGRPDAPTLLLIMGIDLRSEHWGAHFVDALAEHYRVVTFDNRGTGHSTKRVEEITAELWALDALAVLDAVGAERAHVVGYSMGGRIAQEIAVHHPERIERLLLLGSVIGGPPAVHPQPVALASLLPRPGVDPLEQRRANLLAISGPGFAERHPERLATLLEISQHKRTHGSVLQKQLGVLRVHLVDQLPQLALPTLVVHGDADTLVPVGNGEALARSIPGARFERLEGIGHLPTWEAPERLVELMVEFFG